MKRLQILLVLLVVLVVVIGVWGVRTLIVNQTNASATSAANHCEPKHIPSITADAARGQGASAIKPHLCSIPTFNEQDVRQYMSSVHKFEGMRIGQTSHSYIITRVLFVSNQTANDKFNADTGIMDQSLVVSYVEVHGDFTVSAPFAAKDSKPEVMHRGQMVFDGVTGNMLVMGVRP